MFIYGSSTADTHKQNLASVNGEGIKTQRRARTNMTNDVNKYSLHNYVWEELFFGGGGGGGGYIKWHNVQAARRIWSHIAQIL